VQFVGEPVVTLFSGARKHPQCKLPSRDNPTAVATEITRSRFHVQRPSTLCRSTVISSSTRLLSDENTLAILPRFSYLGSQAGLSAKVRAHTRCNGGGGLRGIRSRIFFTARKVRSPGRQENPAKLMFSRPRFGALSAARHAAQPFPSASTNGSRLASYTRGPQQRRFHGELYLRLAGDKYGSEQWHRRHRANRSLRPLHVTRGKKTKSTVKLSDLPQGAIRLDDRPVSSSPEDGGASNGRGGGPAYPTVVLQAKQNMQRFENCVLLTRVGGFYELYFEHAEDYGPMLNLKVAQKKTTAGPVPMVSCLKSRGRGSTARMVVLSSNTVSDLLRPDFLSFSWIGFSKSWSKI